MHVVASFDLSIRLEMAIKTLEEIGIHKSCIYAIPLKKHNGQAFFDTMHHSDGTSFIDGVALCGGFLCALGTIYGFVLPWGGPVIWGLIGFLGGSAIGAGIKFFTLKLNRSRGNIQQASTEVFVLVHCEENQAQVVERILWKHNAFGVATAPQKQPAQ